MAEQQSTGIFGAITRRIFGFHPVDLPEDEDESAPNSTSPAREGGAPGTTGTDKDEVVSLNGGISGKEFSENPARADSRPSLDSVTFQPNPSAEQGGDQQPGRSQSAALDMPQLSSVASHPVELTPGSSMASTPGSSLKGTPQWAAPGSREALTPRSLQTALDASRDKPKAPAFEGGTEGQLVDALPKQVPAVRTKPEAAARAVSPTVDIVDDLLGEVVHGRLTKDSLPLPTPARRELHVGQEQQSIAPGDKSGELKLLSPGKDPVTVPAAPENVPLPPGSQPATQEPDFPKSPFSSQRPEDAGMNVADQDEAVWEHSRKEAGEAEPSRQLQRDQEKAQLLIGEKPGHFNVITPEGRDYPITTAELQRDGGTADSSTPASDSIRTPEPKEGAFPPQHTHPASSSALKGIQPGVKRSGLGAASADLDAAETGVSPTASGTPRLRKRSREPEGPFMVEGPPTAAPKTSEAASSPGIVQTSPLDLAPSTSAGETGRIYRPPPSASHTGGPDRASIDAARGAPTAAEQSVLNGRPVGNPSGKSSGLTPSTKQIAQAKSLAGGKVDPITGHSTLDAAEIGLPATTSELLDDAVASTQIPQPVGAYSSSVAVKPTSARSTDLSNILDPDQKDGSSAITAGPGASVEQAAADLGNSKGDTPASSGTPQGTGIAASIGGALGAAAAKLGLQGDTASSEKGGTSGMAEESKLGKSEDGNHGATGITAGITAALGAAAARLGLQGESTPRDKAEEAITGTERNELLPASTDEREPLTSVQRSLVQASAAPAISELLEEGSVAQTTERDVDEREPLTHVERNGMQTAAAPATTSLHGHTLSKKEEDGTDEREPLTSVKRDATQAAAAPAIAEIHVDDPEFGGATATGTPTVQNPESTQIVAGSTAAGLATGAIALAAAGPIAGLTAAGLAGGAALKYLSPGQTNRSILANQGKEGASALESGDVGNKIEAPSSQHIPAEAAGHAPGVGPEADSAAETVFGSKYAKELENMLQPQGTATSEDSRLRSGASLNDQFEGAWGSEKGLMQDQASSGGAAAATIVPKPYALPGQGASAGTDSLQKQMSSSRAGAVPPGSSPVPESRSLGSETPAEAPVVNPMFDSFQPQKQAGTIPSAVDSTVPVQPARPSPLAPETAAPVTNSETGLEGTPAAGRGSDRDLAMQREQLPSVATSPGQPAENQELATPGSRPQTPVTMPSHVESPHIGATPRSPRTPRGSLIEPRHVDSAADNAKKAAAAVGLGSLIPSIDTASGQLKRSLGHSTEPGGGMASFLEHQSPQRRLEASPEATKGTTAASQGYPELVSAAATAAQQPSMPAATPNLKSGLLNYDAPPKEVKYEEEAPRQLPGKWSAGSDGLLAEEAAPKEQAKAVQAAAFDTKVQSGLDEIEPPPEGVDIKVADPPTPRAEKARAVDTPFSKTSPSFAEQEQQAGRLSTSSTSRPPKLGSTGLPLPGTRRSSLESNDARSSGLVTTGSDDFDAFIDKQAQTQRGKSGLRGSPPGSKPSSNLPASHSSNGMVGAGPDESAVGQPSLAEDGSVSESPTSQAAASKQMGTFKPAGRDAAPLGAETVATAKKAPAEKPGYAEDKKTESPRSVAMSPRENPASKQRADREAEEASWETEKASVRAPASQASHSQANGGTSLPSSSEQDTAPEHAAPQLKAAPAAAAAQEQVPVVSEGTERKEVQEMKPAQPAKPARKQKTCFCFSTGSTKE